MLLVVCYLLFMFTLLTLARVCRGYTLFHTLTPVLARSRAYLHSLVVTLAWPVLFLYVLAGRTLDVRVTSIHSMSEFVRVCLCICVFVSECTFA